MARQEPVYRGIVGIDIARYSRAEWTDPIRARLRERLHRLVDDALAHADIDRALTRRDDVGDGMWLLVAAEVSTARLIHPFLTGLVDRLVKYNRQAPAAEQIRLRLVVHAGEVLPDAHGETGASFIHAARLLDAEATRLVLKASDQAAVVVVASDVVHATNRARSPSATEAASSISASDEPTPEPPSSCSSRTSTSGSSTPPRASSLEPSPSTRRGPTNPLVDDPGHHLDS